MPFCTTCRRTYPAGTEKCPEDDTRLVESAPFQAIEGPDHSTWVEIVSPMGEEEALLLRGFLEAEGIPAHLESLKFHMEPVNVGGLSELRIYVRAEDEARAVELLRRRDEEYSRLDEDEVNTDEGPAEIDDDAQSADDEESV